MATLHVTKPGNGPAPVKGQTPPAASKSNSPAAMPAGHVCTDACTHDGASKGKPAAAFATVGTAPPQKGGQ
jgi:hypothetical protein